MADTNNQAQPVNPLDPKSSYPASDAQILTPEQVSYRSYLEQRLRDAQEARDRSWQEFSNKTYLQYFQNNEKSANTFLPAKTNEDDVVVSAGTIEAKLGAVLANVDALNIVPEVLAFDKHNAPMQSLGTAITDIFDRCAENDGGTDGGDTEKRMLRQKELLKQGTVFVQEEWKCEYADRKDLSKPYDGTFDFKDWTSKLEKIFEGPSRTLLYGPNVYLGNVTQFSMNKQPYAFTVETESYDTAKGTYGQFDNWQYVRPGSAPSNLTNTQPKSIYDNKWRLTKLQESQVEIIKYQDPTRDEFQIIINGTLMLPIGFPLSAVSPGGKINITKQVLYPINPQFAYGKSFVGSGDIYELSGVLDELLKLFVLKTRKSITPPYINTGSRVISKRVLSPGNISQGITPGVLQAVGTESQGVTAGEFQFYKELIERIDASTVSPIFQGQQGKSNTTATEAVQAQENAQKALGVIVAACILLEMKLGYLRLPVILDKWFEPTGETNQGDGTYVKTYRQTSKSTTIDGAGNGIRKVIPVDGQLPTEEIVRYLEIEDEKKTGIPSQRIYLSPMELQKERLTWRIVASAKPKDSSAYKQAMFGNIVNGIIQLVNLGSRPNITGIEDEFAAAYGRDRNKLFAPQNGNMNANQVLPPPNGTNNAPITSPAAGSPAVSPAMTSIGST